MYLWGGIVGVVRVKKDVRITDVVITGGNMSGSSEVVNWDFDSIMLGDLINNVGDYVNIAVTITNFENAEMGIYDIVVPDGMEFEITDYDMQSKICNDSGKCSLGMKKIINIKISNINYTDIGESVKVDFEFRKMHTINYEGVTNNSYPTEIIDGGNLSVSFTGDVPVRVFVFVDGLKIAFSKYSYSNGKLTFNNVSGNVTVMSTSEIYKIMSLTSDGTDEKIDFKVAPSETNGDGVNTFSGTEDNEFPIYYYRGNVIDNNVKFANFCWKMVRTTDTGGIKLVYNGVPSEDGSCNNMGTASQIGTSAFNTEYNSPAHIGYMYGTVYLSKEKKLANQTATYLYGNDVSWDGTNYTLINSMASSSWTTDYKKLATKYHYTCFNDTGICQNVNYINYLGNANNAYYLTLEDGKNIEDVKEEMFTNTTNSTIKTTIDNWYEENMISYTNYLEDTVWCHDRTLIGGALFSKDSTGTGSSLFAAYERNMSTYKPSVSCAKIRDSFTVSDSKGNGKLIYPVSLLTADEYTLAGSGQKGYSTSAYLYTGQSQWSLSPSLFYTNLAYGIFVESSMGRNYVVYNTFGVRPSVSLKSGMHFMDGDGSVFNPYIVQLN